MNNILNITREEGKIIAKAGMTLAPLVRVTALETQMAALEARLAALEGGS